MTEREPSSADATCLRFPGLEDAGAGFAERDADPFGEAEGAEIVHDFKNTLAAVSMLSEVMLGQLPEDSPVRAVATDVRMGCHDALALCDRMLASSRGRCDDSERIDLSSLIARIAPLVATYVPPASTLRFDLADDLPMLDFAQGALPQIVMNLVKNASEALGDRPGVVTVSTGWIDLDEAEVNNGNGCGTLQPGRHVSLAVSDTGCGINEKTQAHMLAGSFTTKTNGHGLGLASVRRIVAAHRAGILLESHAGVGTTVRVIFGDGAASRFQNGS
jgi:signal transduction histidine kinase